MKLSKSYNKKIGKLLKDCQDIELLEIILQLLQKSNQQAVN